MIRLATTADVVSIFSKVLVAVRLPAERFL